jgi:hypothetical protein
MTTGAPGKPPLRKECFFLAGEASSRRSSMRSKPPYFTANFQSDLSHPG